MLVLVFALLTLAYLVHPGGRFTVGGRAHGDGIYTYVYVRSLVLDRDIDFSNDYALLGNPHHQPVGPSGLPQNRFTVGAAVLWTPTFLIGHLWDLALGAWQGDLAYVDGTSTRVQRITLFGSLIWGFGAIVLSVKLAATWIDVRAACLAGVLLATATPLPWYMVMQPSWSHACSAFAVAAFVYVWYRDRTSRGIRGWIVLGALAGLMALVRPQDVIFASLGIWDLVVAGRRALRSDASARRVFVRDAALFFATATLVFAPQLLIWKALYGAPFVIPQGESFMLWGESKWIEVLSSSRNGLFAWTPSVYLGVVGLGMMAWTRRDDGRRIALTLLVLFLAQTYVNGATHDWWGGWAFGGRRMLDCSIAYGLGLAFVLERGWLAILRWRRWVLASLPVGGVLVLASLNLSMMADYFRADLSRGESQSMVGATRRWAERTIDGVDRIVGHPGSVPTNWVFAWRARVPPGRYDLASGQELGPRRGRVEPWDRLSAGDPRWYMHGFGEAVRLYGESASWVDGTLGTLALPMRTASSHRLLVRLRPAVSGARVRITVGGHVVFDEVLAEGWHTYAGALPSEAMRAGMNIATIEQHLPPQLRRVTIGTTGLESAFDVEVRSHVSRSADPLVFAFGATEVHVVERGVTAFTLVQDPPAFERIGTFDTAGDPHAAERFAEAIERLPEATPVVLGVAGPASVRWSSAADAALRQLGASHALVHTRRGVSYALIGARGAPLGSAVEALEPESAAVVRAGLPAAERHGGVAWAWIVLADPVAEVPAKFLPDR